MDQPYLGRKSQICNQQVALTGTYPNTSTGNAMSAGYQLGVNVRHTINDSSEKIEKHLGASSTMTNQGWIELLQRYANNVTFNPINWWFLRNMLGTSTTTGSSDPYTHVFAEATSPILPWFDLQHVHYGTANEIRVYNGCVIGRCSISGKAGQPIEVSIDYIARNPYMSEATPETVTTSDIKPYMTHEASILFDLASAGEATTMAEQTCFTEWNLELLNNPYAEPKADSTSVGGFIGQPFAQKKGYSATLSWLMNDDVFYDLWKNQTQFAMQLYVYRTATDYLKLTWDDCELASAPDTIDTGGDAIIQTINAGMKELSETGANNTGKDSFPIAIYEVA